MPSHQNDCPRGHDERLDLYLQCRPALLDRAASIVGRPRAEDVVQDAWLRFSVPTSDMRKPMGYLFQVVRNLAIDLLRRSSWELRGEAAETVLARAESGTPSPEAQAIAHDDLRAVLKALEALSPMTRRAFELHRFEDRSYADIGRRLGISQGKAHGLVQDAVVHCVQALLGGRDA